MGVDLYLLPRIIPADEWAGIDLVRDSGGYGLCIGPSATDEQLAEVAALVEAKDDDLEPDESDEPDESHNPGAIVPCVNRRGTYSGPRNATLDVAVEMRRAAAAQQQQ